MNCPIFRECNKKVKAYFFADVCCDRTKSKLCRYFVSADRTPQEWFDTLTVEEIEKIKEVYGKSKPKTDRWVTKTTTIRNNRDTRGGTGI